LETLALLSTLSLPVVVEEVTDTLVVAVAVEF
jgi:hypothetical protein